MERDLITDRLKRMGTVLLLLSVLALATVFLVSCSDKDDGSYAEMLEKLQDELDLRERAFEKYLVVIPSVASSDLYDAAEEMMQKIGRNTETEALLIYDSELSYVSEEECVILVGDTSLVESRIFLRGYRSEDFGYKYSDGKVLLGGMSERATLSAIEKFTEDVVNYADRELFMNKDKEYFYRGEYSIDRIELGGAEICEYTVAYDRADGMSFLAATELRASIDARAGYYLRLKKISELGSADRAIYVGSPDRLLLKDISIEDNEAKILPYSSGICLCANNRFGYGVIEARFLDMLCDAGEEGVTLKETLSVPFLSSEISVLRIFPTASELSIPQVRSISKRIVESGAGFISIYGISEGSAEHIRVSAGEDYVKTRVGGDPETGIYHIYSTTLFVSADTRVDKISECELILSGYKSTQTEAEFSIAEIVCGNEVGIDAARSAAESFNFSDVYSCEALIINACFDQDTDAAFGSSLIRAERIVTDGELGLTSYTSGDAISVLSSDTDSESVAEYEHFRVKVYK